MEELSKSQRAYYDCMVNVYKAMRVGGQRIAVPTGLIFIEALKMSDAECDLLVALNNPSTPTVKQPSTPTQ